MMILSVHIPKTAGSTFSDLLSQGFGDRLCLRYEQKPLRNRCDGSSIQPLDLSGASDCSVIHGHFVADRIAGLPISEVKYIVWLRHPVERLVSHFFYWKREPDLDQPICRRMIDEEIDLETFAALDAMRNLQGFFLGARPLSSFEFVGLSEQFAQGVRRFNSIFGVNLEPALRINVNPDKRATDYSSQLSQRAYDRIAALNEQDMALYAEAMKLY